MTQQSPPPIQLTGFDHYSEARQENLRVWLKLAEAGDPFRLAFLRALAPGFDLAAAKQVAEAYSGDAWSASRLAGGYLYPLAVAITDPGSPLADDPVSVDAACFLVDTLVDRLDAEGYWVGAGEGDPNANRFALSSFLHALRKLRQVEGFAERWPTWRPRVEAAVDYQRRSYAEGSPLKERDYGARLSPHYANMDATYMNILGQAARLLDRPDLAALAHRRMELLYKTRQPGGGLHYLTGSPETPNYHNINLSEIGSYARATGDPLAENLLREMAPYLPSVLTADAAPQFWTSAHWKQEWMRNYATNGPFMRVYSAGALAQAASRAEGGERAALLRLLWASLSRTDPQPAPSPIHELGDARTWIRGIGKWPEGPQEVDLGPPDAYLIYDGNRRGFRGQAGGWYYGASQGLEQRRTLVGSILSQPGADEPTRSFFRGAWAEIHHDGEKVRDLSPGQPEIPQGLSWFDHTAAVGAVYGLHPARIQDPNASPPTPWTVAQSWIATPDGTMGYLRLTAKDAPAARLVFQTAVGPGEVQPTGPRDFSDTTAGGNLGIRVFQRHGDVRIGGWADTEGPKAQGIDSWPSVQLVEELAAGDATSEFAVWIGPADRTPPEDFSRIALPEPLVAWSAEWNEGKRIGLIHNPSEDEVTIPAKSLAGNWSTAVLAGLAAPFEEVLHLPPGGVAILRR